MFGLPIEDVKKFFVITPLGLWHGSKLYRFGSEFDATGLSNVVKQIYHARNLIGTHKQLVMCAQIFKINLNDIETIKSNTPDSLPTEKKQTLKTAKNS